MPSSKKITFLIQGKKWSLRFGNPGSTKGIPDDAVCDYDTRIITIRRKAKGSFLNCIAHELLHARCPDLDEEAAHDYGDLLDEVFRKFLESLQ
jgi:hypothetical protein